MNINMKIALWNLLIGLLILICPSYSQGDEVSLEIGQIQGQVFIDDIDSISAHAWNTQYSSHVDTTGNTYSISLQGDQTYTVSVIADFHDGDYYPYSQIYFGNRTIAVARGEIVTNDYKLKSGNIRFKLSINGAPYYDWYVYCDANSYQNEGEKTRSSSQTELSYSPSGEWDMPVVPNKNIEIKAYIYIDGKRYEPFVDEPFYVDVAPGEVVVVPLNIIQDLPVGRLVGKISLKNVGSSFSFHEFKTDNNSVYGYEEPFDYTIDSVFDGSKFYVMTYMDKQRTYLRWPDPGGEEINSIANFENTDTMKRDFIANAGILSGNVNFSGTLLNKNLKFSRIDADGVYKTNNGGGYATTPIDDLGNYRLFLTPGPWKLSGLSLDEKVADYDRRLRFYDSTLPILNILPGNNNRLNLNYCTGSVTVGFNVADGSLIHNPKIEGSSIKNQNSEKYILTLVTATHFMSGKNPNVEVNAIEGFYKLNCYGTLDDGSTPKFGTVYLNVECGVKKGICFNGPTLNINSLAGNVATSNPLVDVVGSVTDKSGVATIDINGSPVDFSSTNNTADLNEVAFSKEIELNPGANTIRTEVTNNSGLMSFDERTVQLDSWSPTISWVLPQDSYVEGQFIPVEVKGADQGSGGTLQVFLDGTLLGETEIAGDDSTQIAGTFIHSLDGVTVGVHSLSATVTDKAGNTAASSRNFQVIPNSEVTGNGYIYPESTAYRANVNLSIIGNEGFIKYYYTKTRMGFNSSSISSLSVIDRTATINGTGTVNGVGGYTYTATVTNGAPDAFGLVIRKSTGAVYYSVAPVKLAAGNLTITQADTSVDTGDAP